MLLYDVITTITIPYFNNFSKILRCSNTLNIFCTLFCLNAQNPKSAEQSGLCEKMPLFTWFWFSHSEHECEWLDSSLRFSDFKAMWWQEAQFSQNSYLLHCHFARVTCAGSAPHTSSSYINVMNIICNFCTATSCQEMCYLIVMIRTTSDCVTKEKSSSCFTSAYSYPPLYKSLFSCEVPQNGKHSLKRCPSAPGVPLSAVSICKYWKWYF